MLFKTFKLNRESSLAESAPADLTSQRLAQQRSDFLNKPFAQRSIIALVFFALMTVVLAIAAVSSRMNTSAAISLSDALPIWWMYGLSAALAVLFGALYWLWSDFLKPMAQLKQWLLSIHAGNLSARLPESVAANFACINADLNTLATMLETQSRYAERQLREHTEHITQKTRSLAALYRIATSINTLQSMDEVFNNVLKTLEDIFNLDGAMIRLRLENGGMWRVAQTGTVPAIEDIRFMAEDNPFLKDSPKYRRLVIPLKHYGDVLGICCLYLDQETFSRRSVLDELFASVGYHLGMVVVKSRLDEETKRLSIMKERTRIAHELHDSLAQTISSLRFQARVLDQAMHENDEETAWRELEKLENDIESANREVRNLIVHFRDTSPASLHKKSFRSIDEFVRRFRRNHPKIKVFVQKEWAVQDLPVEYENEILRVIQEALANVYKHSGADFVRLLLRDDKDHNYFVMIEDNGCGMENVALTTVKEGHFGLTMMRECAARIKGELVIDTEPGEGTRVKLRFRYPTAVKTA